jgi:hypothetical protein
VSYWVWIDTATKSRAIEVCKLAGVDESGIDEDPYAEPTRYHVWVSTPEEVVALYKVCNPEGYTNARLTPSPSACT